MAKEDFCFTYYDGDAARDMAHMNRLERGGYTDLIISQRKFGHLSLARIKKTLGSDFDQIWPSLADVLKKDAEENFFIEWVDTSIEKMRRQSKKQSENGKQGGRPKSQIKANENPTPIKNESQKKPLGNGDGIGNVFQEGGPEETIDSEYLMPQMAELFQKQNPKYPRDQMTDFPALRLIAEKIFNEQRLNGQLFDSQHRKGILLRWGELIEHIKKDPHLSKYSLSQINKHFQSVVQSFNNGNSNIGKKNHISKPVITGTATGAGSL